MLLLTALLTRGCQKTDEAPKVTTELSSLTEVLAAEEHDGQTADFVAEAD